jgi:hypothetical protein
MNKGPFLGDGSVNTLTTIKEVLNALFSVGSAPRQYNEYPSPAEVMTERELRLGSRVLSSAREMRWLYSSADSRQLRELTESVAWAAVTRGPELGKLKNLHC